MSGACDPTSVSASSGIPHLQLWIFLVLGLVLIVFSFFSNRARKKKDWKKWYLLIGILLIFWSGFRFYEESLYTKVHIHANFKVFIDGKSLDFSQPEFMTESKEDRSKKVHLHDLNGGVVHVHYPGITWKDFFESLGMKLSKDCLDAGRLGSVCNLSFFSDSRHEIYDLGSSEIRDLDRVLITNSKDSAKEISLVPDDACIYSGKCPERGPAKGMEAQGLSCSG